MVFAACNVVNLNGSFEHQNSHGNYVYQEALTCGNHPVFLQHQASHFMYFMEEIWHVSDLNCLPYSYMEYAIFL